MEMFLNCNLKFTLLFFSCSLEFRIAEYSSWKAEGERSVMHQQIDKERGKLSIDSLIGK